MPGRRINGKMSKKLVGLFLAVILAVVALAVRITYINATSGAQYERIVLSQTQQQYENRVIPFKRGDILDRNGTILATSERVYSVILDCKVTNTVSTDAAGNEVQNYVEPTIDALVNVLGLDEEDIRGRLTSEDTKDSQYQVLKTGISIDERQAFEDYLDTESEENADLSDEEKEARGNVRGVWFEENYERVYPMNSQACDLIGFTYDGTTADWGIEGYYSSLLNGVDGRQYGYYNEDSDVEQNIVEPVDGKNVVSTIDINIQQIIRTAIENYNGRMAGGPNGEDSAENVGVIVMDPDTGEILGMDSSDWYDLNNPRDLTAFYTEEEIAAMDNETMLDNLNSIWRNFCISDTYEPGSTFKPLTVAAALESGSISQNDSFYCEGYYTVSGQMIRCAVYPGAHYELSVAQALAQSCNACLMQIGEQIGISDFVRYQKIFNFGSKTGIDLPGESSGVLFTEDEMGPVELATSTFGQGFNCTMIQEAAAFCSLINGGYYYTPHVVSAVTDSSGSVVQTMDSMLKSQTVSQETSDFIREALAGSVNGGSGSSAKVEGYSMGGKTGTAQKFPRSEGKYLVSFIGFAPLDDPEVVVYVVVDEPNAANQADSTYAQLIAKEIFTELLPYLNIYPDETGDAEETPAGAAEQGADNENLPAPAETPEDESVENGGNSLLDEGISNSEQELLEE